MIYFLRRRSKNFSKRAKVGVPKSLKFAVFAWPGERALSLGTDRLAVMMSKGALTPISESC